MEYRTTSFLNELGLEYNVNYYRSVKYKDFTDDNSRMDCDYRIICENEDLYIEVVGLIDNLSGNWREKEYPSKVENDYRDKMKRKEYILNQNGINYLFLFADDFENDIFKRKIKDKIKQLYSSKSSSQFGAIF